MVAEMAEMVHVSVLNNPQKFWKFHHNHRNYHNHQIYHNYRIYRPENYHCIYLPQW